SITAAGRKGVSSSARSISRTTSGGGPSAGPTTRPVTVRRPSGTRTRAPRTGVPRPGGTRYVRSGSAGTGAATEMSTTAAPLFVRGGGIRQTCHDHLHVLPDLALRAGISQQVGRVKSRHHRDRSHPMELAAHARNRRLDAEERLRREFSERDDHHRIHRRNLRPEERRALLDLVRLRIAVIGGPALHDVRDVHLLAREAHRLDDLREQLPGPADERLALQIFIGAWAFADEHQPSMRVADAEDDVRAPLVQLAASAVADLVTDLVQFAAGSDRPDWRGRPGLDGRFNRSGILRPSVTFALTLPPSDVSRDSVHAQLAVVLQMSGHVPGGAHARVPAGEGWSQRSRRSASAEAMALFACNGRGSTPAPPPIVTSLVSP